MKKQISVLILTLFVLVLGILPASADNAHPARVVDECGVLDATLLQSLNDKMDEISNRHQVDVALLITANPGEKSYEAFADDYFDYNGYGIGENFDGIMLVYFVEGGDNGNGYVHITTCGMGIDAITDANEDAIFDRIASDIVSGNYEYAFTEYADMCDEYITDLTTFDAGFNLVIALAVGFIVAFIATGSMKSKLKSVAAKKEANSYLKPGSLMITDSRDMFLYRQVTYTKKEQNNSSDTHTSSSGRTHGGGGRSL